MRWSLSEISETVEGRLDAPDAGGNARPAGPISIDSRTLVNGEVFLALTGERFDGHAFVSQAFARGASGAVVTSRFPRPADLPMQPFIRVESTEAALAALARRARAESRARVVAVTGSNGKTTTREMVATILEAVSGPGTVLRPLGNRNNPIGVPLTLLQLEPPHRFAVLELAMNHAGEVAYLTRLARPHVALITNVGRAHIGFLGSLGAIRKAKLEVAEGLDPDGWLLVPGDDSALAAGARRTGRRVLTFGPAPADCIVRRIERVGPFAHEIELAGYPPARVESPARAMALAGIAALSTVSVLGVEPTRAASALSAWRPAPGRMAVHERDGVIILDDSYNANPDSMRAALETLSEMPCDGRRIAVLGDMRELGEHSAACHRELGLRLGSADVVYLVGEEVRETESAAKTARPACDVRRFTDRREVARIVKAELRRGDVVLVKGSRAMQLDLVVGVLRGVEAR